MSKNIINSSRIYSFLILMNIILLFVFKGKLYILAIPWIIFQVFYIYFNCLTFYIIKEECLIVYNGIQYDKIFWRDIESISISKMRGYITSIIICVHAYKRPFILDLEKGRAKVIRLLKIIYNNTNKLPINIEKEIRFMDKILSYNVESVEKSNTKCIVKGEYLKIIFFILVNIILMVLNLIPFYKCNIKFWIIVIITAAILLLAYLSFLLIRKIVISID